MSLISVGASLPLSLQLHDGATGKFVRAFVRNQSDTAVTGSPFALTHVAQGLYTNSAYTVLISETKLKVTYVVYDDAGFTTESVFHTRAGELFDVETQVETARTDVLTRLGTPAGASVSVDIAAVKSDTATLTSRLTSGRADNLDNLDTTVSSRASQASLDAVDTKLGTPAGASVSADIAAVKVDTAAILDDTGTTGVLIASAEKDSIVDRTWDEAAAGHVSAGTFGFLANLLDDIEADTSSLNDTKITTARANNLDNLDATVSSRATAAQASSIQSGVTDIQTKIGTPVTSLAADIASVQGDTNDIQSKIGSPVATLATDIAGVQSTASAINTKLGTPAGASVSVDIASIYSRIGAPVGASISADIASVKSSVLSVETKVDDLSSASDSSISLPETLLVPTSGSNVYRIYWRHFTTGVPSDPASGPDIEIQRSNGTDIISSTAMTKETDGVFYYDYTISDTAETGLQVLVKVTYKNDLMGPDFQAIATANQTASASVIEDILTILGTPDTGTIAGDIDQVYQNQLATGVLLGTPDVTFADDLRAVKSDTAAIKTKTDQLAFTGGNVNARANVVADKTGYTLTSLDKDALVDLIWDEDLTGHVVANSAAVYLQLASDHTVPAPSIDAIADAVWDEQRSLHNTLGSFGAALQGVISTARASALDNLDATVSSRATQTSLDALQGTADTIDTKIGTPTGVSLSADVAAVKADTAAILDDTGTTGVLLAPSTRSTLVDEIWDEPQSSHSTPGTFGDRLDADISSRQAESDALSRFTTLESDIASVQADTDDLQTKIGTPAGVSVSADIASLQADLDLLTDDSELQFALPYGITRPDTGSITTRVFARLVDATGDQVDPDLNQMTIRVETSDGTVLVPNTFMNRTGPGAYDYDFVVSASDPVGQRVFFVEYLRGGDPNQAVAVSEINSYAAEVQQVIAALTAIKSQTDQFTFTGSNVNANAQVVSDKTGYALSLSGRQAVANLVWDTDIIDHLAPGTTGEALSNAGSGTPVNVATAVWDELVASHNLPSTFGNYLQVARQSSLSALAELNNPSYGLSQIFGEIGNSELAVITEVNQNETKIDAIIPYVASQTTLLKGEIDQNQILIEALATQLTGVESSLAGDIGTVETKVDALSSQIGTIQNNTTVRFVVPDRLIKPASGSKTYQFHLRLYDETGHAQAPDSTPTIRIRRLDTGIDVVAGAAMTPDGVKVGAYYYNFTITAGTDEYQALVEATVIENGATRYVPAVTEITEFESDLNAIQAQLTSVQGTVVNTNTAINSGVYGLAALKAGQTTIVSEINQNEVLIQQVKSKTDLIPSNPATSAEVAAVNSTVLTRPALADIVTQLNLVRDYIVGPDNRNNTAVYNRFDISTVMKTNDPRLNFLDANVSSRSTLDAAEVWSYGTRELTSFVLPPASVKSVWDYLASQATVNGSLGKILAENLDVKVSTRATSSQVASALAGVAQESTVSALAGLISSGDNQTQIDVAAVKADTAAIRAKTQNLPSDPVSASVVTGGFAAQSVVLSNLDLKASGIKTKTDNLPPDPAKETSVLARPTNPVLATDLRLARLDVNVSSRGTLSAGDIAGLATAAGLAAAQTALTSEINANEAKIDTVQATVNFVKARTDLIPAQPVSKPQLDASTVQILTAIDNIDCEGGSGLTAAEVWTFPSRTITQDPQSFGPDISDLATKEDVESIEVNGSACRMSTTLNSTDGTQEVIVWLEKNGVPFLSASNARIKIKSTEGDLLWEANLASPNTDGVFAFSMTFVPPDADRSYYVEMLISDGTTDHTGRAAFITVG